jgi:ABC-2 type transport system ATP-binding protein
MKNRAQEALVVADLRKEYEVRGGDPIKAVDGVSFSVNQGEVVGLLGANGAGKSTTLKCIATLIRPTSGKIMVMGKAAVKRPRRVLPHLTAVLEGNRNIYWRLSVLENLRFFAGLHGLSYRESKRYIEDLIDLFRLGDKARTPVRQLSRGMQQKAALACAFVKRTDIVLLDEPTLGLDVETSRELRQFIKSLSENEGRTILLSSHDMDVVQSVCPRVVIIKGGQVVTDDKIANLQKIFQAKTYTFRGRGNLDSRMYDRLSRDFPGSQIEQYSLSLQFSGDLTDPQDVFRIVEIFRSSNITLDSITRELPDLEEIFLKVIEHEQE